MNNNIQVQRIRAIGLTVTDGDLRRAQQRSYRSLNFYTQALGFKVVSDITVAGQNYSELEGLSLVSKLVTCNI